MMNDCANIVIREQLPDFMHGTLDARTQLQVQEHLEQCADCSAELALLQAIKASGEAYLGSSVRVDVQQIAAAIPAYQPSGRLRLMSPPLRLAAGFLIAAIGISAIAITHQASQSDIVAVDMPASDRIVAQTTNEVGVPPEGARDLLTSPYQASPQEGIALVSVNALSNEELEELIDEVSTLEPLPPSSDASELADIDPLLDASFNSLGEI